MALESTQGGSRVNVKGVWFLPLVSEMYSLKVIKLVPNLAKRACGSTIVYPGGF